MYEWLIFGILSYFCYALSTSLDKVFMNRGLHPIGSNLYKMFFNGIILIIIGALFFQLHFTLKLMLWSLILGTLYAAAGIIYFTALKLKDVDVFVPYYQASTILILFVTSTILFKETVNGLNYLGVFSIIVGVYLVLLRTGKKIAFDKGFFLILATVIIFSAYSLLAKVLLADIEPINLSIMMYFASALVMTIYAIGRRERAIFKLTNTKIAISALFGALGTLLIYISLTKGAASKVFAITGVQSAFVFIIAILFFHEKFSWRKFAGTAIIAIGIFLVSL